MEQNVGLETNSRKKFYWLIALLVVLLAGAAGFKLAQKFSVGKPSGQPLVSQHDNVQKQEIPKDVLPTRFPADFPVEKDAVVEQNYSSVSDKGNFQATRSYKSTQSLNENEKIFTEYLKKNSWTVSATKKTSNLFVISAVKEYSQLIITVNSNAEDSSVNVDATLVDAPQL